MVQKTVTKKKTAKKIPDAWHLKAAYALGNATQKVSNKISTVKTTVKKRAAKKNKKTATKVSLWDSFPPTPEPLSPLIKELRAIADISGLTEALEEMNAISMKHSKHPVIERLAVRMQALSPFEQEQVSRNFIEKLNRTFHFNSMTMLMPSQVKLTEEDCQKMSTAFIECISETLEDIGLSEDDRAIFAKLTGDIAKPINDLMQFYICPKTFGQKMKRLWRIQRIFIKMIKLVKISHDMNKQMPADFKPVEYLKLEGIYQQEKHTAKPISKEFIIDVKSSTV
ncbi:MAG: hypothetical protein HQL26_05775 [Candidatus Omnitrophica bacterium]|nr:hypothetical protein [Candidatus Omnitrophota bacterium]